jgi:hypothetical protein
VLRADDVAGIMAAFGVAVTVNGTETVGIWRDPYQLAELGDRVRVSSSAPEIEIAAGDAEGLELGDPVVLDGNHYEVVELKPDGFNALTRLRLIEAAPPLPDEVEP